MRSTAIPLAVLVIAASALAAPALAQGLVPAKPLPAGFRALPVEADHGEALLLRVDKARIATALAAKTLARLGAYYDARPRPGPAYADKDDAAVQVVFEATRGGVPLAGVLAVEIDKDGGATVAVIDDRRERFAASLPALGAALRAALPGATAPEIQWQQVQIPGDQGTLALPSDWRITGATGGMVDVAGPRGSADFGIWMPIMTPEVAATMYARQPMVCRYGPPSQVLVELYPMYAASVAAATPGNPPPMRFDGIIEKAPCEGMPGPSEFVLYDTEGQVSVGGPVTQYRTLALISVMPNANGFVYYTSSVTAVRDSFAEQLPTMLKIWGSWKVSASVLNDRLQKAAESMRETTRIINETNRGTQKAADVAMEGWSEYMRGQRPVRDEQTGETRMQWEQNPVGLDKVVEEKNRAAGYERWRIVPPKELVGE